jgi:DNA repair protein RadC
MRSELQAIDVAERMKALLFAERPQLADLCQARIEAFEADHSIRYYKERLLAGLAGADARAPSQLRELSRAVRRHEEEPEEFRREIVAEERPPFYDRLSKGRREAVPLALGAFARFGDAPREAGAALGKRLRDCVRLEDARNFVRETFPGVKGLDVYRVLKSWEYPVVLPDMRRQTLFYRLGALPARSVSETGMRRMTELCESIQRQTNQPLQTLDVLTGAFTGIEPGIPQAIARCLPRPQCGRCPIASHCDYFKFQEKPKTPEKRTTIKDWKAQERPRERLAAQGPAQLSDAELMAIVLRTGTAKDTALGLAHNILRRFDGLRGIDEAALAELCGEKGMGPVKSATLKAAIELGKRVVQESVAPGEFIRSSSDIYQRFQHRFTNVNQEQFYLLCLNTKNAVVHERMISQGSLAGSLVHPREAFKEAIRHSAAGVAFVHNHPSGDPAPSGNDYEVTNRLRESSRILGIPLVDHIVIGQDRYFSFQDDQIHDFRRGEAGVSEDNATFASDERE